MIGGRSCLLDNERTAPDYRPTGDYVRIDKNRVLYFVGRKDDLVKRMGKRLNLCSVEKVAMSSSLVKVTYYKKVSNMMLCYLFLHRVAAPS